jgi:hypothetical protein
MMRLFFLSHIRGAIIYLLPYVYDDCAEEARSTWCPHGGEASLFNIITNKSITGGRRLRKEANQDEDVRVVQYYYL